MRYDKVITLVAITYSYDSMGVGQETEATSSIFANEFTISRAEFYDAGRSGLHPSREFQVRSCEYNDQPRFRIDSIEYDIIRTEKRGEWIRLIGQERVHLEVS